MGGRENHGGVKPHIRLNLRKEIAQNRPRHGEVMENLIWQTQLGNDLPAPALSLRVYQVGGCGVGVLILFDTSEFEIEVFRDHQHPFGILKLLGMLPLQSHELVNRIEWLVLYAGSGIQFVRWNDCVYILLHSLCAVISVGHRIPDDRIHSIQKHIIHRPGVNSHGFRDLSDSLTLLKTAEDTVPQVIHIPAVVSFPDHLMVVETLHFLQNDFSFLLMAQNVPPGGRADVNC